MKKKKKNSEHENVDSTNLEHNEVKKSSQKVKK